MPPSCPSMPTCGLGLAESERALPSFINRIEKLTAELGLAGEEIIIRSTGCPNGCARPYMAELAFVGKAPGSSHLEIVLHRPWEKDPPMRTFALDITVE